ncbi:LPS export ABC transporter periplasmic protein LptC [Gramella sp. AN32]|uniref:LPS export ABC transporter periplasmic protein LptC n=1 Tax=Christiangramia antarctica TaxID=2058158 RepID=A0ABW5X492_9FLAO|nr:LPS export ABC transporter periplasmic protein LptC [Gramella sp. AN32]MCM4156667.1 LPS export ABC transporter periplasmic protein LptC [Gramella sp. AN32]
MKITYSNIIYSIVTLLGVTMFFSCEGNLQKVRAFDLEGDAPQAIAEGINLKFTDSGRLVANLISPKMYDFTNKTFPYREFPEGLQVEFFDEDNKKNTVNADYGIVYEDSKLVDLQGNVVIVTADSTRLQAEQLYWDQESSWVFTDHANTIKFPDGSYTDGQGFDASQNFDKFSSRTNDGIRMFEDTKTQTDTINE